MFKVGDQVYYSKKNAMAKVVYAEDGDDYVVITLPNGVEIDCWQADLAKDKPIEIHAGNRTEIRWKQLEKIIPRSIGQIVTMYDIMAPKTAPKWEDLTANRKLAFAEIFLKLGIMDLSDSDWNGVVEAFERNGESNIVLDGGLPNTIENSNSL